jgi:hypothetical protein
MAEIADGFAQWMRDYVTAGMPGSGQNQPDKAEGRALGPLIEAYIDSRIAALDARVAVLEGATEGTVYTMPTYAANGGQGFGGVVMPDDIEPLDIAIMQFAKGGSGIARPSGWEQAGSTMSEGGQSFQLFWRRCDGTEGGQQIVFSGAGCISTWRGCVENGDPFESLDTNHGTGGSQAGRSVTTLGVERRVVNFFTSHMVLGAGGNPDVGFTEAFDEENTGWNCAADIVAQATAGTVAAPTRSATSGFLEMWCSFSLALIPNLTS